MEFKIDTDLIPKKSGLKHSRDNWLRPEADKMNDGYDYLNEIVQFGFLKLGLTLRLKNFL